MISSALKGGRRLESRTHPSNPEAWLVDSLSGGVNSATGTAVNESIALKSTAFFAAIRFIGETIASLPLHLYRRLDRGKERAIDRQEYHLLHLKPNPEMTSMNYRESQIGQAVIFGNAYSEKELDNKGRVKGLWPLLSKNMTVHRKRGQLLYSYLLPDGTTAILPRSRVLHIPAFGQSGLSGYNIVNQGREAIGLSLALEEYSARFFSNNAKPAVVLEHPAQLGQKSRENLRESWQSVQGGLSNAHRLAILEEGMKLHEYGISPEDAQAIESKKFSVTEIARITNLPPHILRDLDKSSFSNIEQQSLELVIYSLRPWIVRFDQNYTIQLLSEEDQLQYFFEHLIDGLLRGDTTSRWDSYSRGFQMACYSPNDILEMENRNPYEGGDNKYIQLSMVPVGTSIPVAPRSSQAIVESRSIIGRDRINNRYYPIIRDVAQRIVNREAIAVNRQVKKLAGNRGLVDDVSKWLDDFYEKHKWYVESKYNSVIRSFADAKKDQAINEVGVDLTTPEEVEEFISNYIKRFAERHVESSHEQLISLLEGDLEDIAGRVDEWQETRADKIARDEVTRGSGAILSLVAFASGVGLIWRTRGAKTCPYCKTLDGVRIKSGEYFVEGNKSIKVGSDSMLVRHT
ncbi:MAG: phage portal protein, partial [Bacteroidota bacterium]